MARRKQKDMKTTIAGSAVAVATAAAPFFPQYATQIQAAQAIAMALFAYFAKDAENWKGNERRK